MEELFRPQGPIIESALEQDFYTFTQGQMIHSRKHTDVPVKFSLFNRSTDIPLADLIDQKRLERELNHFATLKPTLGEIDYLLNLKHSDGRPIFNRAYLNFLSQMTLPPYTLKRDGDQYQMEIVGPWGTAIYWEVPALRIFLTLYVEALMNKEDEFTRNFFWANGIINLSKKIEMLSANPGVTITDFGTRRAASPLWHEFVVKTLKEKAGPKQFIGTSNTFYAMKHNMRPMGTNSHQGWQTYSGIYGSETLEQLTRSQQQFCQDWWDEHGHDFSIGLTDTFGTNYFLRYVFGDFVHMYKGARQDSGQPSTWAEDKMIPFYKAHGVNPMSKIAIMSDGLMTQDIPLIFGRLGEKMWVTFGWGTNLTNNLHFKIKPPSLVIKAVGAVGRPLVKLSDNPDKAIGNPEEVAKIKQLTNYCEGPRLQVIY